MAVGIEFGMIAVSALFWIVGWMIDTFKWTPAWAKPWIPACVAAMGALTLSTTWVAGVASDLISWIVGVIPGGQLVLGVVCMLLLAFLVYGLGNGRLDKRDVGAIIAIPILTLSIGGPFGDTVDQLRNSAQDATLSVVSSFTGA